MYEEVIFKKPIYCPKCHRPLRYYINKRHFITKAEHELKLLNYYKYFSEKLECKCGRVEFFNNIISNWRFISFKEVK